jgi:hypothetical protein
VPAASTTTAALSVCASCAYRAFIRCYSASDALIRQFKQTSIATVPLRFRPCSSEADQRVRKMLADGTGELKIARELGVASAPCSGSPPRSDCHLRTGSAGPKSASPQRVDPLSARYIRHQITTATPIAATTATEQTVVVITHRVVRNVPFSSMAHRKATSFSDATGICSACDTFSSVRIFKSKRRGPGPPQGVQPCVKFVVSQTRAAETSAVPKAIAQINLMGTDVFCMAHLRAPSVSATSDTAPICSVCDALSTPRAVKLKRRGAAP